MIGINQVGCAIAVQIRPSDSSIRADGGGHAGDHSPRAERVVAQVQPVPALAGRRSLQHQVGQAIPVDVGQLGARDLCISQDIIRQRDGHRFGEPAVTEPRCDNDPAGPHPSDVRDSIAVAIGDLHGLIRKRKARCLLDRNRRRIRLIAEIEPDAIGRIPSHRHALHDIDAFVKIQISRAHVGLAEGRGWRRILHGHCLSVTPGNAAAVSKIKNIVLDRFVDEIRQTVSIHVSQVCAGAAQVVVPGFATAGIDLDARLPLNHLALGELNLPQVQKRQVRPTVGFCFENVGQPVAVEVNEIDELIIHHNRRFVRRADFQPCGG